MTKRTVSELLLDQCYPSMIKESSIVSPTCQRIAYVAHKGKKRTVGIQLQGEQLRCTRDKETKVGESPYKR